MKLLIVDDNKYVVTLLRRQLNWEAFGIEELIGVYSVEEAKESVVKETEEVKATEEPVETEAEAATGEMEEQPEQTNHNEKILALYSQGKSYVEIAKELGLGQGEVRLVVGLYKGVDTSEV